LTRLPFVVPGAGMRANGGQFSADAAAETLPHSRGATRGRARPSLDKMAVLGRTLGTSEHPGLVRPGSGTLALRFARHCPGLRREGRSGYGFSFG